MADHFVRDDWAIPAILEDANGEPLDLTSATFHWALLDGNGNVVPVSAEVTTTGLGEATIAVDANATLAPGFYFDALRLSLGQRRATIWRGAIAVSANRVG